MLISQYLPPVAAGIAFHALPTVLGTVFPRALDDFPCSSMRKAMREYYDSRYVNSEEQQQFHYVTIPDNIGFAGAFTTGYFMSHGMSLWEMDLRFSIFFVATMLHVMAVISLLRRYSLIFGVPLTRKFPVIGETLAQFFIVLAPSDQRPYYSVFEKFVEIIRNSAFVKALIKAASEVGKLWVGIPMY